MAFAPVAWAFPACASLPLTPTLQIPIPFLPVTMPNVRSFPLLLRGPFSNTKQASGGLSLDTTPKPKATSGNEGSMISSAALRRILQSTAP